MASNSINISDDGMHIADPPFTDRMHRDRQEAYRELGRTFARFLQEKGHHIDHQTMGVLERVMIVVSVIDFMMDELHTPKEDIARVINGENPNIPSFNEAFRRLRRGIEECGDYAAFIKSALLAVSHSNIDTVEDRHKEALYLAQALASAICKDATKRSRILLLLRPLLSLVNFTDDVKDYHEDEKSIEWMRERRRAALRQMQRLKQRTSRTNAAH